MASVFNIGEKKKTNGLDIFSVQSIAESLPRTSLDQSAPYSRIFSKNNVCKQNLPDFLRTETPSKGITLEDLRRVDFLSIPNNNLRHAKLDPEFLRKKLEQVLKAIKKAYFLKESGQSEISDLESRIIQMIEGSYSDYSLTIKSISITSYELSKIVQEKDLGISIVNAFMQHLKQLNRVSNSTENFRRKINIASEKFSDSVISKGNQTKQKNLSMKSYDYFVFPIFDHYWRLLVHEVNNNLAYVFDLGRNLNQCEAYVNNLKAFWNLHEESLDEIEYRIISKKGIHLWDSGIYILKVTYQFILGLEPDFDMLDNFEFRIEILITLLKLNQINL